MKKIFLVLSCVFLFFIAFGCRPPAGVVEVAEEAAVDPALTDEDLAAIEAINPVFKAAVLAEPFDIEGFLTLFTDDMVMIVPNLPAMESKAVYREWLTSINPTMTRADMNVREVAGCGDVAYLYMKYDESFIFEGEDEPYDDTGNILAILKKQPDGSWLISHWIWNSDKPLAE